MIHFIVVEDNNLHIERVKKIINKYMMRNNYEYDILCFNEPNKKFLDEINSDSNKIYILDFELKNTNAIDVSRLIRKVDWISAIIVFSVNGGMAYETFKQRLQILDFVNKQFEAEKNLFELFDICFDQFNIRKDFKYKIGKISYSIDYNKIYYIYRDTVDRKCVIVTDKNEYRISKSLANIKELLPSNFLYTHKSCIVNIDRVDAFDFANSTIYFDNNTHSYLLSKTHKKELEKYVVC